MKELTYIHECNGSQVGGTRKPQPGQPHVPGFARRTAKMAARAGASLAAAIAASLLLAEPAFGEAGHPTTEPTATPTATPSGQITAPSGPTTQPTTPAQAAVTDPFALNDRLGRLRTIADSLIGTPEQMVGQLFQQLHRGGPQGVQVMDMTGRPPRTAAEASELGGDCTDIGSVPISILRARRIPGGVLIVHFNGRPESEEHMLPYAMINGRRVIIDLQTDTLGQTAQGTYTVILDLTFDQAAEMYHREMGDYYRDRRQAVQARTEYEQALAIFEGDAYVHQNLSVLYEQAGDMARAARHSARAAQLDPRYGSDQVRGSYNEELQAAQEAIQAAQAGQSGAWADCVRHLTNALQSGEPISADDRSRLESQVRACQQRADLHP